MIIALRTLKAPAIAVGLCLAGSTAARADDAAVFFDSSVVHEIRLTFTDTNWFAILQNAHAADPGDPFFPCRFEADGIVIDPCGVKMKGNSSFGVPGVKKPFKLDFNEYDKTNPALHFHGLTKLSLNNNFKDPTMIRELLFHEFVAERIPSIRIVPCRLVINGTYWGLYNAAENPSKDFVQSRFGSDEDGNLYKAEHLVGTPGGASNLSWLGADPTAYWSAYELETNEITIDYSGLVEFINVLNNTPASSLKAALDPLADADALLHGLAFNNLFVNLDSYTGSAHNYYVYERTDTGKFTQLLWDANEAFGTFRGGIATGQNPRLIPALWLPTNGVNQRPLMEKLWAVSAYQRMYLRHLARALRTGFDTASFQPRITQLANLIRADVTADVNKQFTTAQFEQNLSTDIVTGGITTYGLTSFISQRAAFLDTHLDTFASRSDLQVNELMSVNGSIIADQAGDFDPWVEIYNLGPGLVNINEVFLSDTTTNPGRWLLPGGTIDDGEFRTYWLDGEPAEGTNHANFALSPAGGTLVLSSRSGGVYTTIGTVNYPALATNTSFGRSHEESATWAVSTSPSPGAANRSGEAPLAGALVINEFMAVNTSTITDEAGDFADWVELHNTTTATLDIGGAYLSDDPLNVTQWKIPVGTQVSPGGFVIVWADNETGQGPLHAVFKLSATGESVILTDRDGATTVNSISFGAQTPDVSYGRTTDGSTTWGTLPSPSPGASNNPPACPADLDRNGVVDALDLAPILGTWGQTGAGLPGDVDGDDTVGALDLAAVLGGWGPCP